MADAEEVVDGVYVELNASRDSIKRFIQKLITATTGTHHTPEATAVDDTGGATDDNGQIEVVDDIIVDKATKEPIFAVKDVDTIEAGDSTQVGVYASNLDRGIPFIQKHKAWGFIKIAADPEYFCIYLTRRYQQVQLIAVVDDIVSKEESVPHKGCKLSGLLAEV